jgi:N-acetylneuraminic acid mutarotase
VPWSRLRVFVPLALFALVAAACGGGGSGSGAGLGGQTTPTSTTPPSSAATTGTLQVAVAPFHLPAPASREVLLTDGHQLIALGGLDAAKNTTGAVNAVDLSSGAARAFGTLSTPSHDAAGVLLGGRYLVIGGGSTSEHTVVQALEASGGTSQTIGNLPQPRADHVAALLNGTIYALGGGQEATALLLNVVASTDGATWRPAGQLAAPVRYPGLAVVGGAIYLFGGVTTAQGADTASIQRYDPATGTTQVVAQLPAPLSHTTAVVLGNAVYLLGGYVKNVVSNQILRVDLPSGTATPAGSLPTAISDAAAVTVGRTAYLAGGQGASGVPVDTILTLTLG